MMSTNNKTDVNNNNTEKINNLINYKYNYDVQFMRAKYTFEKGDLMNAKYILDNIYHNNVQDIKYVNF